MMKGRIAIYDRDPKTWRSRGKKRRQQPDVPTIITGVRSPKEIDRAKRIAKLPYWSKWDEQNRNDQ